MASHNCITSEGYYNFIDFVGIYTFAIFCRSFSVLEKFGTRVFFSLGATKFCCVLVVLVGFNEFC